MYEQKSSKLPFIQLLWRAKVLQVGEYDDPAKESWGLAFTKRPDGSLGAELLGPAFHYKVLGSAKGDEYWGAEFYPYVTMRGVDKPKLTGRLVPLHVEGNRFFVGEYSYEVPSFDELEDFLEVLAKQGIISHINRPFVHRSTLSLRSKQRHNLKLTGLTLKQQQQIRRAELANNLLKSGMKPIQVAAEAGYADQAHMTRSLKLLLGKMPSEIG